MISTALPFVLRHSKDERRVFQQNLLLLFDWGSYLTLRVGPAQPIQLLM
jgi:hypothetical protein